MGISVAMVTCDTTDASGLGSWWAEQLGGEMLDHYEGWFVVVRVPDGPTLAFQKVENPTPGKNRLHLDLTVDNVDTAATELVAAGATLVERRSMEEFSWVTLADPDGNEFCIAAE